MSDYKSGWLFAKYRHVGVDLTPDYHLFCSQSKKGDKSAFSVFDVTSIVILMVPGLFTNHYPGYMKKNIRRLEKIGVDVRKAPV